MNPIRVLVLEDDEDIVELVRSILEPGYETLAAGNGEEGLQLAEAGEPDLVICDIMMPVMDGWEFMRTLRSRPGFEHTPVIFLSALSSADQIKKGYELGAALYLTKPLNAGRLKRNIELFISDHGIEARPKRRRMDQLARPTALPPLADEPPRRPNPQASRPRNAIITPPPQEHPPVYSPAPAPPPPPPPEPPRPAPASPPPRAGGPGERVRVLVVDDDKDTCQMIHAGLEGEYDIVEAGDGITAMERALRFKPDIFVIDGMLPRMTGYQLTLMIKKNREFYRSPIVFISGKASARDREYARGLGITSFMAKPFTPEQLQAVLREITARPEFTIHTDRVSLRQEGPGEHFSHFEAHRPRMEQRTLDEIEEQRIAEKLRQQLR